MAITHGWIARLGAIVNQNGPWGGSGKGDGGKEPGGDPSSGGPSPNPWTQPPGGGKRGPQRGPSFIDELTRSLRGGKFPGSDGGINWRYVIGGFALLWVAFTSVHRVGPQEEGVVTRFGRYAGKLGSGVGFTMPAPIDRVQKVDVREIRTIDIPKGQAENLILTADQNIVDLDYTVRWSRRNAELFLFQLADPDNPDDMISQVAESAMREVVSTVSLNDAIGSGRGDIETRVQLRMQALLDKYRTGVSIQGVAIQRADPPSSVNDAFKRVTAAQQTAQTYVNQANAYAQQISAKAQGEATSFDKVYAQYKLAPGVTRRRMYYETMEGVLAKADKTIVDAPGVMPYLPLPEVRKRQVIVEGDQ